MRLRLTAIAAVVAALVLAIGPSTLAQPLGGGSVSFDDLSFTFDAELGSSVNITRVPGQPPDTDAIVGPQSPHIAFSLYGEADGGARVPRVGLSGAVVRAYATAELADYEGASTQLEDLRTLLANRPDLGEYMVADASRRLPHLPLDLDAAQVLRARATYIDTPQLSGIAYLVAYRQDVFPFSAGDFWYTFQGLSTDGTRYVSADFAVDASMFPARARLPRREQRRFVREWDEYVAQSTRTLNEADPGAFTPPLTSVDSLIESITFASMSPADASPSPAASPSAGASPSPAASPSAGASPSPAASPSAAASLAPAAEAPTLVSATPVPATPTSEASLLPAGD